MKFEVMDENSNNQPLNLDKDELYDLYIIQQKSSNQIARELGCSGKSVQNYLMKYGIPMRKMPDAVKIERSTWSDEKELQRSIAFHNTWSKKSPDERKAISDKKHISPKVNSPEAIAKAHATRELNGTNKISKSEDDFYHYLLISGIDKTDILRNKVIDSRYPFNCDFYIKSKDLFIEYQGHQTHGTEPFDETNKSHIDLLNKMTLKGYDMSTWTKRDPNKLRTALKNNISLVIIYPKHKTYLVQGGEITTIDINDINKI